MLLIDDTTQMLKDFEREKEAMRKAAIMEMTSKVSLSKYSKTYSTIFRIFKKFQNILKFSKDVIQYSKIFTYQQGLRSIRVVKNIKVYTYVKNCKNAEMAKLNRANMQKSEQK